MAGWSPLVCTGVLVGGLLLGGAGGGVAAADPGRGDTHRVDRDGGGKRDGERRAGHRRGGREDGSGVRRGPRSHRPDRDRTAGVEEEKRDPGRFDFGFDLPVGKHSVSIPVLRLQSRRDGGACGRAGLCLRTIEVPVPTLDDGVSVFAAQPEPEPTPGPTMRGQGERPQSPVLDASGGEFDEAGGSGGAPAVLEMPVLVAPPPMAMTVFGVLPGPAAVGPVRPGPVLSGAAASGPAAAPTAAGFGPQVPAAASPAGVPAAPAVPSGPRVSAEMPRSVLPSYSRPGTPAGELVGALPGLLGLFLMTITGGFIGYRQASAGRYVRSEGADRFLQ